MARQRPYPVCDDCRKLLDREWDNIGRGFECKGEECDQVLCSTCDQIHWEEHGPEVEEDE